MIALEYIPADTAPDEYLKAKSMLDLKHIGQNVISGVAQRRGITRPGYREFATYRIALGWSGDEQVFLPGVYVYEVGRFYEVNVWHDEERQTGRYPVPVPTAIPARKRKGGSS